MGRSLKATVHFSGGASLPLGPSRRFTVVIVYWLRLRVPRLGDDRDVKLATLIHPAGSRNEQVRAVHIDRSRGETTMRLW